MGALSHGAADASCGRDAGQSEGEEREGHSVTCVQVRDSQVSSWVRGFCGEMQMLCTACPCLPRSSASAIKQSDLS